MTSAQIGLWAVLGVALLVSVVTDVVGQRIPDRVTYATLGLSLALRLWLEGLGGAETGLVSGAVGALLTGCVVSWLAWSGRMGWGDVKLLVAMGAALGFPLCLAALVFISLVGAAQGVLAVVLRGAAGDLVRGWWARVGRRGGATGRPADQKIPYAVAIALGSFWAMWWQASSMK